MSRAKPWPVRGQMGSSRKAAKGNAKKSDGLMAIAHRERRDARPGQSITLSMSAHSLPCVSFLSVVKSLLYSTVSRTVGQAATTSALP